jgi:hypothetical protein
MSWMRILLIQLTSVSEAVSAVYLWKQLRRFLKICDRRMSAKLVPIFADRVCRVVSATDPHGR